jgi:murein L,D-transpeptidase YafK
MRKMKMILISISLLFIGLFLYLVFPEKKLPPNIQIDKLVVYKSKRELLAYSKGQMIKKYTISLGSRPIGAKEFEGDKKTPEGHYYINDKNPNSCCYKNIGISYPNKEDMEKAKRNNKPAGGSIKIHGLLNNRGFVGKLHRWYDWTAGCIAVTDEEVEELYNAVKIGTKIEIKP